MISEQGGQDCRILLVRSLFSIFLLLLFLAVPRELPPTSSEVGCWRDDLSGRVGGTDSPVTIPSWGLRVGEGLGQDFLSGLLCISLGHEIEDPAGIIGTQP